MAFAFDTLAYAKHLRDAGVEARTAEAHAEAAGKYIMNELATRSDLEALRQELHTYIDNLGLRLTIRLGAMLGVGIAALATIIKLHP